MSVIEMAALGIANLILDDNGNGRSLTEVCEEAGQAFRRGWDSIEHQLIGSKVLVDQDSEQVMTVMAFVPATDPLKGSWLILKNDKGVLIERSIERCTII